MSKREFEYHVHISERNSYIYFEVPKSGSTTIKSILQDLEALTMGKSPLSQESSVIHNKKNSPLLSPSNIGVEKFSEMLDDKNVFKFGFVRNPYTRLLSAFLSKMKWKEGVQRKMIVDILNLKKEEEISFTQFIQAIDSQNPFRMDPHWRPQVHQLFYNLIDYDFIGRFEHFNEDLERVLHRITASSPQSEQTTQIINHLTIERKGKNTGASSRLRAFYNKDLQKLVNSKYKEDFLRFNYSSELP